jgi:hypothetical protein
MQEFQPPKKMMWDRNDHQEGNVISLTPEPNKEGTK